VFVARQAFGAALDHIRAGCLAQEGQGGAGTRFAAVGLHLLHGLVLARHDALDDAHAAFAREVETAHAGHVYGREACANACYARGALYWRAGDRDRARLAFADARSHLPSHPIVSVLVDRPAGRPMSSTHVLPHVMTTAALLSADGRHADAARLCDEALAASRSGPGAAWVLPVEPLIHVTAQPLLWTSALTRLQQLAS
jgi:hypothetical protein